MHEVIDSHPLGTVISGRAEPENITLVPFIRRDVGAHSTRLVGHVDRNNPHSELLQDGEPVSFVFRGPDTYASPDLYPDAQLPGWLYVMVKGRGTVHRLDEAATRQLLVDSTEELGDPDQLFELDPRDPRIDQFIGGIMAFEIEVSEMSGIAKLAQDKGADHCELARRHLISRAASIDNTPDLTHAAEDGPPPVLFG
jgi:transcriptional regulator